MNPNVPNPIPAYRPGLGSWPVTAAVKRRGRRALGHEPSRKELRHYRRHLRRQEEAERRAEARKRRMLSRESPKTRKRRLRKAA